MTNRRVESRAEEGGQRIQRERADSLPAGSPRNPLSFAVVEALTALLEELGELPDFRRARLLSARRAVCGAFGYPVPEDPANATDVAQQVAEEDGEEVQTQV